MKMKLKNNEHKTTFINKLKKHLTLKNLIISFLTLFITAFIIGIVFYLYLNNKDKEMIKSNLYSYFTISDNYNYLKILKKELFTNLTNTFFIWLLGISVIGIIVIVLLYFIESFSLGFTITSIIDNYKLKGIIGMFSYLFPSKIIYILNFILICLASFRFSLQLIKYLFLKQDIDLKKQLKKYLKVLLMAILITIIYTLLDVFITPLMIKIFTKI